MSTTFAARAAQPGTGQYPLLDVAGVTAGYGSIVAIRDVNLVVNQGEIVAVLGTNGAGKTTTLAAIAGLVRARAGTIRFAGEDIGGLRPEEIVRRGLSLAPEGRRIFAKLTVGENLVLGGAIFHRQRQETDERRKQLLELFPVLATRLQSPAGTLSGGEQQQLAIARSLMSRPRLLLLDEPTLGLAPKLVRRVFTLIRRLRDEHGTTVLLVEQNVHQALGLCDRAYVMRTGRIEMESGAGGSEHAARIKQAYLGIAAGSGDR